MSGATHWTSLMNIVYSLTCAEGGKSSSQLTNNVKCNHYYRQCQMQPLPQTVSNATTTTSSVKHNHFYSVKCIHYYRQCQTHSFPQTMSNGTTNHVKPNHYYYHKQSNTTTPQMVKRNQFHKQSNKPLSQTVIIYSATSFLLPSPNMMYTQSILYH